MQKIIPLFIIFSFLLICCERQSSIHYTYHPPENTGDGFETGSLSEVNIDSALIVQLMDSIFQGRYKEMHSILIYRNNRLVIEEYFKGHEFKYDNSGHHGAAVDWDRSRLHRVMSVTKSITSVCVGLAVDRGFVKDVQQSIFDYLPEYRRLETEGKNKITIEHLLTMTSGLQGNEWLLPYANPQNDIIRTYQAADPLDFILSRPLVYEPGSMFQYYGGSNIVLGEIVKKAADMSLDLFAEKYLFGALGIAEYEWLPMNKGVIDGAGGLLLRPRDMAKIGVTFLHNGSWCGEQIISAEWVKKSAESFPGNSWLNNWDDYWGMKGYAYSWWTHTFSQAGKRIGIYYASGWGGQYIMIIPDLDLVAVFTGSNYLAFRPPFMILKKYILPALN
jgi:CubicO group peptidase (beta-lactamase class C family)